MIYMPLRTLRFAFALLFAAVAADFALAQPPDPKDRIGGQILDEATQKPIERAEIAVFYNSRQLLTETVSDDVGYFLAAPLLEPGSTKDADQYLVLVYAHGYTMTALNFPSTSSTGVEIKLKSNQDIKLRVVSTKGDPIADATITAYRVRLPVASDTETETLLSLALNRLGNTISLNSGEDGLAALSGMPDSGDIYIRIQHPEYNRTSRRIILDRNDSKFDKEPVIKMSPAAAPK